MAVRLRQEGVRQLVERDVASFVAKLGKRIALRATRGAPRDTGRLSSSIKAGRVATKGLKASVKVSTETGYGLYPEIGTGVFGPTGRPIRPKKAPFLVFQPRGLGHVIRVRSVRGQPGQHYMRQALISEIRAL